MDRTYRNASGETLANRNPRFDLAPGDTVVLTAETISHIVRGWIRAGALELVPEEEPTEMEFEVPELAGHLEEPEVVPGPEPVATEVAAPVPAAKKPAARKPAAKPVAKPVTAKKQAAKKQAVA